MPATHILIGSTTFSSTTPTITFSTIPQTYTDLRIKCSIRTNAGNFYDNIAMLFNGSTTGYSSLRYTTIFSTSNTTTSDRLTGLSYMYIGEVNGSTTAANTFGEIEIYIPNYTSTSQHKIASSRNIMSDWQASGYNGIHQNQWSDTSAITSITIQGTGGNMLTNSTVSLYGIKNT